MAEDTKQTIFYKEIIFKHLPHFRDYPTSHEYVLETARLYPKAAGVENLTEHALALLGEYNFIDAKFKDFDDIDESDSKTVSVNPKTRRVELGSIALKVGALRITIYNPLKQTIDYMYIPYDEWQTLSCKCSGKNTDGKRRLIMTWNAQDDHYNQFEQFRLSSFEELATMNTELFRDLRLINLGFDPLNISSPD